jgi:uracil-DNA glycosylase
LWKNATQTVFGERKPTAKIMLIGEGPGIRKTSRVNRLSDLPGNCLGATAAQALLGRDFRVTQHRGEFWKSSLAPVVMATVHPSSILRVPDEKMKEDEMRRFIVDLKRISKASG